MSKGALIGFGGRARELAAAAAKAGLELTAVCEPDRELAKAAAAALPGAAVYLSTGEFFSRCGGLSFALVNCRPEDRARTALRVLENRLHAACETPMCFSSSDFESLREKAAAGELSLFPLQPWERGSAWLAVMKALDGKLLGEPRYAGVKLLSSGPSPEGGVTAAFGWQAFSMLLALARRPPLAMSARLTPPPSEKAADSAASFQVHFGGVDGSVYLASGCHRDVSEISVIGSAGTLRLEGGTLNLDIKGLAPETAELRRGPDALAPAAAWLEAELADFAAETAKDAPRGAGLRNSRYCARLLKNALYSASLNSAAVPL